MAWCRAILALSLLAGLLSPALSTPSNLIYMPTDELPVDGLSADFHAATCPQLDGIVLKGVQDALKGDIGIAAGLLRIFFHDCFPQGCDASIMLKGEVDVGVNAGSLQKAALKLIDDIRVKVHSVCGATVSCADITGLATRDAVVVSGGQTYAVPLGRNDSLAPAKNISMLPSPFANLDELFPEFAKRKFDLADLVALSGAHTVGKARCGTFRNRFTERTDFTERLRTNCSTPAQPRQDLDVATPNRFDNAYYKNLLDGKGVFTSDQTLARDGRTRGIVTAFSQDQGQFFARFGSAMTKLTQIPVAPGGEIRRFSCFTTNAGKGEVASA